jgi:hypothetical protein
MCFCQHGKVYVMVWCINPSIMKQKKCNVRFKLKCKLRKLFLKITLCYLISLACSSILMLIIISTKSLPHGAKVSWIDFCSKPKLGGFQLGFYKCIELSDGNRPSLQHGCNKSINIFLCSSNIRLVYLAIKSITTSTYA